MYTITYNEQALKDISSLDGSVKQHIQEAIESKLLRDPKLYGKALQYDLAGARSFRVGDYRVVFDLDDTVIHVWLVAHRKHVYPLAEKRTT